MRQSDARKRVLVTGGAGYAPVVYDNLSRGHAWAVKWGSFERGDLLSPARLAAVIKKHRPFAVLHFAALAYEGESVAEPQRCYHNNVGGTINLLQAMREAAVSRIVFSSTCAVYGVPKKVPIPENHPPARTRRIRRPWSEMPVWRAATSAGSRATGILRPCRCCMALAAVSRSVSGPSS